MVNIQQTPYKSIVVETTEGEVQTLSEGDKIRFITEDNAEIKKGTIVGFKGTKPAKVEVEMIPEGCKHHERWSVIEMQEGSLKLQNDDQEEE